MTTIPAVAPWMCPPRQIVIGVDFGDASARAVAVAKVVSGSFHARLRAVHAERFDPPPYFTLEQIGRLEAERRASQAAAADHLARFVGTSANQVESIIADAPPVDALVDASANADLLVIGTHGRRGPSRWWLGSVAERVLRAVAVPVLVVRAANTSPRDMFARVLVVGGGNGTPSAAVRCAEELANIGGGGTTQRSGLPQCDPQVLQDASLVVVGANLRPPAWRLSDDMAGILGACERPVLFIPAA
ncbi:MAG TPA: universal stress protein [Vicinamibacterales bacterium]|nr:universal stress protein [Vicinamibacterales bacterium]